VITALRSNPDLWKSAAVFITGDEGDGYYDSDYVQPLDFFGDGTRIPLIAVSPYSLGDHVKHSYTDPRLDPEVHRGKLGPADNLEAEPRQSAQS
jgi:phospholipase C